MYDYIEYHTCAKDVDFSAIVHLLFFNLRGHICFGPLKGLQLPYVFVSGKPEISQLQVEVVVHEDVLELQVAVDDTRPVEVSQRVKYLSDQKTAAYLINSSQDLAKIKKRAAIDILENQVHLILYLLFRGSGHVPFTAVVLNAHDVFVAESTQDLNLLLDGVDVLFCLQEILMANDLQRHLLIIL